MFAPDPEIKSTATNPEAQKVLDIVDAVKNSKATIISSPTHASQLPGSVEIEMRDILNHLSQKNTSHRPTGQEVVKALRAVFAATGVYVGDEAGLSHEKSDALMAANIYSDDGHAILQITGGAMRRLGEISKPELEAVLGKAFSQQQHRA